MNNFYIRKYYKIDYEIVHTILFGKYISNNAKDEDIYSFCENLEVYFVDKAIISDVFKIEGLKSQMQELLQEKDKNTKFRLRKKSQLLFNSLFHTLSDEDIFTI